MSIEDRVRAATRARADLVTPPRPLALPASTARARRGHGSRRWLGWGAPLAAAAMVVVLAVALVAIRPSSRPQPSSSTSPSSTSALASVPRYYVYMKYASGAGRSMRAAVVGDVQTGRALTTLTPPLAESFYGVTGASDDRTFVVMGYSGTTKQTTFYLLLLGPGGHLAHFSKLPIKPISAQANAVALSPGGQELAVTWADSSAKTTTYLSVYSVRTGAVLDSYLTRDDTQLVDGEIGQETLSWVNGDRALDFSWAVAVRPANPAARTNAYYLTMRGLNLSAGDHDLLADSRQLMKLPAENWSAKGTAMALYPCASSLAVSDGTLVCGSSGSSNVESARACAQVPVTLTTYSALTGRQRSVLYASHGQPCGGDQAQVLWTDPGASHVLVLILRMETQNQADTHNQAEKEVSSFGVVTGGHLITLPRLTGAGWPLSILTSPYAIAF